MQKAECNHKQQTNKQHFRHNNILHSKYNYTKKQKH
jgi:hypothetical protein